MRPAAILTIGTLATLVTCPSIAAPAKARKTRRPKTVATAPPRALAAPPPVDLAPPSPPVAIEEPAVSAPAPIDRDRAGGSEPSRIVRSVTITMSPLSLAVGRYGASGEVVVARHHAIGGGLYVQTFPGWMLRTIMPSGVDTSGGAASRVGGEIGYRYYTGSEGPRGFFVGPSFVAMPLVAPRLTEDLRSEIVSFDAYGAALDVGVQAVHSSGFTIGGGLGVMALAYTPPASASPPGSPTVSVPEPHVLPRLLFSAGWSF